MTYLEGTFNHRLIYRKAKLDECKIVGYVNYGFFGDLDERKTITSYCSCWIIAWSIRKQTCSLLLLCHLQKQIFVVVIEVIKESKWLSELLNELWFNQKTVKIFCNNQSVIQLTKNYIYHERTKHINVKLHFIRDEITKETMTISKIHMMLILLMCSKKSSLLLNSSCVNLVGVVTNSC